MDEQLAGIIGQGGVAASLIAVIFWLGKGLVRAVEKLADKIDGLGAKVDEHTKDLAVMSARVEKLLGPAQHRRASTNDDER